jgi:hypothetical protein
MKYYLVKRWESAPGEGYQESFIGPFEGPNAEEDAHNHRLIYCPNEGVYVTRHFDEHAHDNVTPTEHIARVRR